MNKITSLILDVDGTLTDGKIHISLSGELYKTFDVKDGLAIRRLLPDAGIKVIVITGRSSDITTLRCKELEVDSIYQGVIDKEALVRNLANTRVITPSSTAYMGDDINDLEAMLFLKDDGGYICCPNDAVFQVKEISDYIANLNGGNGAVREAVEHIIELNRRDYAKDK